MINLFWVPSSHVKYDKGELIIFHLINHHNYTIFILIERPLNCTRLLWTCSLFFDQRGMLRMQKPEHILIGMYKWVDIKAMISNPEQQLRMDLACLPSQFTTRTCIYYMNTNKEGRLVCYKIHQIHVVQKVCKSLSQVLVILCYQVKITQWSNNCILMHYLLHLTRSSNLVMYVWRMNVDPRFCMLLHLQYILIHNVL